MSIQKIELTDANFEAETSKGLCVICFGEPVDHVWRKHMRAVEEAAAAITEHVKIAECDVKKCFQSAERLRVSNIPSNIIFKNGTEVDRSSGYLNGKKLIDRLKKQTGAV